MSKDICWWKWRRRKQQIKKSFSSEHLCGMHTKRCSLLSWISPVRFNSVLSAYKEVIFAVMYQSCYILFCVECIQRGVICCHVSVLIDFNYVTLIHLNPLTAVSIITVITFPGIPLGLWWVLWTNWQMQWRMESMILMVLMTRR